MSGLHDLGVRVLDSNLSHENDVGLLHASLFQKQFLKAADLGTRINVKGHDLVRVVHGIVLILVDLRLLVLLVVFFTSVIHSGLFCLFVLSIIDLSGGAGFFIAFLLFCLDDFSLFLINLIIVFFLGFSLTLSV